MSRRRRRVFRDGKVHVRRTMCETCIFRAANLMDLRPGVRDAMVAEALERHSAIPCHETLGGEHSVCSGFYKRADSVPLAIAAHTGKIEWTK